MKSFLRPLAGNGYTNWWKYYNGGSIVARITIEDCLKRIDNRFKLVHMAAARVRQIREGSEYLVSSPKNEDIVVSLREVAAGKVVAKERREANEDER
jgi:DNA-directed RNA polymerase subunit omega